VKTPNDHALDLKISCSNDLTKLPRVVHTVVCMVCRRTLAPVISELGIVYYVHVHDVAVDACVHDNAKFALYDSLTVYKVLG
jgi:hypothetical protein